MRVPSIASAVLLVLLVPRTASSVNWYSCPNDLDELGSFAADASIHARQVSSARQALESCRDMAQYAPSPLGCSMEADNLDRALRRVRLDSYEFTNHVNAVSLSCGYDAPHSTPPHGPRK
jgi:hypothetical protein